jgi:hypothetical protein
MRSTPFAVGTELAMTPGARAHHGAPTTSDHRSTPPEDVCSRQVSWLAGRRCCLAFPTPEGASDTHLTAARRLQLRGQPRLSLARHRIPS